MRFVILTTSSAQRRRFGISAWLPIEIADAATPGNESVFEFNNFAQKGHRFLIVSPQAFGSFGLRINCEE